MARKDITGFRGCGARGALCAAVFLSAAWHPGDPSGLEILKNVEEASAKVNDYSATLEITADIERLNVPPMKVRLFFKRPDKIHIDAEGFALLPREGLVLNAGRLMNRYTVKGVARESSEGVTLYALTLIAKSERTRLRTVLVYVDPARWTVEKLVMSQPGERMMSAAFRYAQVDGFWLPSELVASFAIAPADTSDPEPVEQVLPPRPSQKPRKGSVTVRYAGYSINTGLSDELFKDDPARPPD